MLYITTRSKNDPSTAVRTMNQERGSDGGLFVPMRMPELQQADISALKDKTFGQNVADILNLFFSTKLTGWDVDMSIGRYPMRIKGMNHRVLVAELWRNIDGNFERVVQSLANRIHLFGDAIGGASNWVNIAVRIAALFGVCGELMKRGELLPDKPVNIAVTSGSFAMPMAAWYARQMGLPIGKIICGCNENGAPWELLHQGEVDTGVLAVETSTPDCDYAIPQDLERLVCAVFGQEEAMRYWWSCTEGGTYSLPEPHCHELRKEMFVAVVSHVRVGTIIPSVYRTNQYILDPYATLAYGALSDYRSRTGDSGTALIFSEKSPLYSEEFVSKAMRITAAELKKRLSEE